MTVEQMVAELKREGWQIWNMGQTTRGGWACRLYDADLGQIRNGLRGAPGYDRECWRYGTGPTMLTALGAAAAGLLLNTQNQQEESLDLAAMLS